MRYEAVIVKTVGPPSPGDPLGRNWETPELASQNPGPSEVEGLIVGEHPDGRAIIRVGTKAKGGREEPMSEGDGVGEYQRLGGVTRSLLRMLKVQIAPLLQDQDASIRTSAEVVAALFGRGSRKDVVQQLAGVAASTKRASAQRVQALTLLGVLLAQEIDR